MRCISPSKEPFILASAFAGGIVIGFAPLQQLAIQFFGKPGFGNAIAVNLMLPAVAIAIAAYFPRIRTVIAGGVLVVLGFTIARFMYFEQRPWAWNLEFLTNHTSPILVGAAVGCAVLSVFSALVARNFRRVGTPLHMPSCASCRHALAADAGASLPTHCPECGTQLDQTNKISAGIR